VDVTFESVTEWRNIRRPQATDEHSQISDELDQKIHIHDEVTTRYSSDIANSIIKQRELSVDENMNLGHRT